MSLYENIRFILKSGEKDKTVAPVELGKVLEKYGYKYIDETQKLKNNITIYSTNYFCNANSVNSRRINYAFHINSSFWVFGERTKFARFFGNIIG